MATKKINPDLEPYIAKLREVLQSVDHHSFFWSDGKGADNSKAKVFTYARYVPIGQYFLCDCIGNTVDLCLRTKRNYRNADGRSVPCIVIETIIPDCRKQLGSPVNGCWQIPYHLLNFKA